MKDFHPVILILPSIHTSKYEKEELSETQKTKRSSFLTQFDHNTIEFCINISAKVLL